MHLSDVYEEKGEMMMELFFIVMGLMFLNGIYLTVTGGWSKGGGTHGRWDGGGE